MGSGNSHKDKRILMSEQIAYVFWGDREKKTQMRYHFNNKQLATDMYGATKLGGRWVIPVWGLRKYIENQLRLSGHERREVLRRLEEELAG